MSLSLPLVACGYLGSRNKDSTLPLPGAVSWSQQSALPFVTTQVAPGRGPNKEDPGFTVIFPVDTLIAIGDDPDAAVEPHFFVPALTERSYYAKPGDKLSAIAAV